MQSFCISSRFIRFWSGFITNSCNVLAPIIFAGTCLVLPKALFIDKDWLTDWLHNRLVIACLLLSRYIQEYLFLSSLWCCQFNVIWDSFCHVPSMGSEL